MRTLACRAGMTHPSGSDCSAIRTGIASLAPASRAEMLVETRMQVPGTPSARVLLVANSRARRSLRLRERQPPRPPIWLLVRTTGVSARVRGHDAVAQPGDCTRGRGARGGACGIMCRFRLCAAADRNQAFSLSGARDAAHNRPPPRGGRRRAHLRCQRSQARPEPVVDVPLASVTL